MLSFEQPAIELDGLTVYHDHEVADQFYYLAPHPQIARTGGTAMFDLFAYTVELQHSPLAGTTIPAELGAGFLEMGVQCTLSTAQESRLRRKIAEETGLDEGRIRLARVPYHKGSVQIIALDNMTSPAEPPANPASADPLKGRPTFVEESVASASPMLLGDLRAMFSLRLSQNGFALMEGLYEQGAAPVGVVYELKFYGLRPSIDVEIVADLSRIYTHFGGGLAVQYAWFKADVTAGLDYLKEQGAITIRLTSQQVGAEADKSKELALSIFRDRIAAEMFRPIAAQPPAPAVGVPTTAVVGLSLKVQRTEDLKTMTYNFSERAPDERIHAPQAFLQLLISKSDFDERVHTIDLHHDFFELLEVLLTGPTRAEFDALRIRQVEATLTYGRPGDPVPPESATLLFRPDSTGDKTFSVKRRGRKTLAYTYSLLYEFVGDPLVDAEALQMAFENRPSTRRTLLINPTNDFGVLQVEVKPGHIDASIRRVEVELAYRSPDGPFTASQTFRIELGPGVPPPPAMQWQVRSRGHELAPYTAACRFVFTDGAEYWTAPAEHTEPVLFVDSPFRAVRTLLIRPNVLSQTITRVSVEVEYDDPAAGYSRRFNVDIDPPFDRANLAWPILDAGRSRIRYRVTTQEPGVSSVGEWSLETDDTSVIAGAVGSRLRVVAVRLIGPTLADAGLDGLMVKVRLAGSTDPDDAETLVFEPGGTRAQDAHLTVRPGVAFTFEFQTTAIKATGETVESGWREGTSNPLLVSTRLN